MFRIFRNLLFLSWLAFALATTTIAASIWAATMTYKVAHLSADAASTALRHRKEITRITAQSANRIKQITAQNARRFSEMAATQKAEIAKLTARHRAAVRKALLRAKARARIRRYVIAVPFLGAAAVAYFEKRDYDEWKTENPNGTETEYLCLMYMESKDVVEETRADANAILASIPDDLSETLPGWFPKWAYGWIALELPDLNALLPSCDRP